MGRETLETTIQLAAAAFGLVAALAWNAAIQGLFEAIFGEAGDLAAKFLYAILITIVVVLATIRLGRLKERVARNEAQASGKDPDERQRAA
jgi:Zn-dependent protease with chaperone function